MAKFVSDLLMEMFPRGTRPMEGVDPDWHRIPVWAPDLFAFTATLVEQTGACRLVAPDPMSSEPCEFTDFADSPEFRDAALAYSWGVVAFDEKSGPNWHNKHRDWLLHSLEPFDAIAFQRLDQFDLKKSLHSLWDDLLKGWTDSIDYMSPELEGWKRAAVKLMLIADEASQGLGFFPPHGYPANWLQSMLGHALEKQVATTPFDDDRKDEDRRWFNSCTSTILKEIDPPFTFDIAAFSDHICAVLPKTRTSTLGCTIRSMSHHLALLPPSHTLEARWRMSPFRPVNPLIRGRKVAGEISKNLNLLIIPYPYRLPVRAIGISGPHDKKDWGYFHIEQQWLKELPPADLASFVCRLVKTAESEIKEIHGVIFPEFALNGETFEKIADELRSTIAQHGKLVGNFEFLLAGISELRSDYSEPEDDPVTSNYVQIMGIHRRASTGLPRKRDGKSQAAWSFRGVRAKHHRWKIDSRQISRYGLSSVLDPDKSWWEGIALDHRRLEFYELRADTCMTAMICEDLARADPVQEILRSVGPNLVVALLMDGPQRRYRWPGHYAGVLADDPGCSTLTVTSTALVDRAAGTDSNASRAVAFFKDCTGNEQELVLPVGAHALAISLHASSKEEHTLDQRGDGGAAYRWHLSEVVPVTDPGTPKAPTTLTS